MIEKSGVIVVLYTVKNGQRYFYVFERKEGWKGNELLKGGIEEGESPEETAFREVKEEAGIELSNINKSKQKYQFISEKNGVKRKNKFDIFYQYVEPDTKIKLDNEHSNYGLYTFKEAMNKLSFVDLKTLLSKVDHEIDRNDN